VGEICNSVYKPWHFPWTDRLNIEVQKALTGQISSDQCCDNLIAAIKDVQKT
jgi:multiple sugar transport system substrate-binding protein